MVTFPALKREAHHRVLLADDHVGILQRIRGLLGSDYDVVAIVDNGILALKEALELQPDLILLDIEMPGMDGIQVAREIRRRGIIAHILFLSVHGDEEYIAAAQSLGNGYILKSHMATDLHTAIQEAFAGRFFLSRRALESNKLSRS